MMVMGLAPVVGVPLPLVSFGGSAVMTVMLCLGLLMALERQQRTVTRLSELGWRRPDAMREILPARLDLLQRAPKLREPPTLSGVGAPSAPSTACAQSCRATRQCRPALWRV